MNYKKTTLSNGLRVITALVKSTQTVTVVVMVGVGSRYETDREAGLSHFIEHMFFKGTKKRPTGLAVSEELDAIGGEFNAFTGKDKTGYFAKADAKHIDTVLDVVADIYLNSKIEEAEIKKEKGTIIQELNMYEDTPVRNIEDVFESLLYGKNSLGREIVGYKKTLNSFRRKDLIKYMQKFYVANDTVVAVAGKFDEKKTLEKIKKYFSGMKKGKKPGFEKAKESQKTPQIRIKFKKTDQTHFLLGVRAFDFNHPDRYALSLLSVILGGNMSSRLFTEVREKKGLAYYVRTQVAAFEDCGYVATQAGVEHKNLELAVSTILKEYKKISQQKVGARELQKAKDYVKGGVTMNLESSDEVAMFYTDQEISRKKIMPLEEIFSRIDKVSQDDILKVAKSVFQSNKLNLAVIGPKKDKKSLVKLLKI